MRMHYLLPTLLATFCLFAGVQVYRTLHTNLFLNTATDAAPTTTSTLSALADAYTFNGTNANTNYGTATTIQVKTTTTAGYARASYLKFSLGSATNVTSAKLRLYGRSTE